MILNKNNNLHAISGLSVVLVFNHFITVVSITFRANNLMGRFHLRNLCHSSANLLLHLTVLMLRNKNLTVK
jgi:hypothetical protein